jgi:hypothetical protein
MGEQSFSDILGIQFVSARDTVRYIFRARGSPFTHVFQGPVVTVFSLLVLVALPAVGAGLALHILSARPWQGPWYQVVLVGLFALQMGLAAAVGAVNILVLGLVYWLGRRHGRHELAFDRKEMHFGCNLAGIRFGARFPLSSIRQVKVFIYPDRGAEDGGELADLSLAMGEDRATYGILRGFDRAPVEALARDLSDRLGQLLSDFGAGPPLDPPAVIETTPKEAGNLNHTLPRVKPRGCARLVWLTRQALWAPANYRAIGLIWGALLVAGGVAVIPPLCQDGPAWGIAVVLLTGWLHLAPAALAFRRRKGSTW